ncbi:galactokinase [Rhodovarius crocodyli]|uniref:Galactokinase n=1 Tax=Rhodovarius crocodyli TaxID=1979269 RepID=A0A437MIL4_9PROT|nr:galactokinase [Rhodovarius crocodyli]RVT97482.1 galactokinase [Rhodovarius crocodyli]
MIIARSPLRISIGGGGTDLPSYYQEREGFLLAMAIRKHVYVSLQRTLEPGLLLKYSQIERPARVVEIQHPIIRESLLELGLGGEAALEITSVADIPAGTGLGSSGSFTTALLKALHALDGRGIPPHELAEQACRIEIDRLGEPIGKQDQYIAAMGGLTGFTFRRDGTVAAEALPVSAATLADLQANTLMFFTGRTRSAGTILAEQDRASRAMDAGMLANLDRVKALGYETRDAFLKGDLARWGEIMREHWEAKKRRSGAMSNPQIDAWYDLAMASGAVGGKLVGAGGGGFLLFYAHDVARLRAAMRGAGLAEVPVVLDPEGTTLIAR